MNGSDDSYHTPPVVSSSSSGSDKENVESSAILVEIKDEEQEVVPYVRPPALDFANIKCLIAVRGQRVVRSSGPPRSFHPYARCCAIGDRDSTH